MRGPRRVRVKACLAALDAAEVPCSAVQTIDQVLADPQIEARNMIIEAAASGSRQGQAAEPAVPVLRLRHHAEMPAPLLGQHNRIIAESLGYSEADIAAMTKTACFMREGGALRWQPVISHALSFVASHRRAI